MKTQLIVAAAIASTAGAFSVSVRLNCANDVDVRNLEEEYVNKDMFNISYEEAACWTSSMLS